MNKPVGFASASAVKIASDVARPVVNSIAKETVILAVCVGGILVAAGVMLGIYSQRQA